jgi:TonB family protein
MNFSNTATEQREKEIQSVKSFLAVSLIGSLTVHIGMLAFGLSNLLFLTPQIEEDKPIEITFIEPQTQETPKLPEEKIEKTQPVKKEIEKQEVISPRQPVREEPRKTTIADKPIENSVSRLSPNPTPAPNNTVSEQPSTSSPETSEASREEVLTGNEANTGIAFDNTATVGRKKRETFATRSIAPNPPTEIRRSRRDSNGSGDGRASCRECDAAYPEQARRNGVEGRVEVAVDTDEQGNVTNVRVVRSSGNNDLDEATIRQAREWKLKPSQRGRQGVTIGTEYAIEGSNRHRQLQEIAKQRQAQQRRQQTTAVQPGRSRRQMETATSSASASTTRQQSRVATSSKKTTPSNTATTNRPARRSSVATNSNNRSSSSAPRRVRRSSVATNSTRNRAATTTRRQRQQPVVSKNTARQSTVRRRRELNGTSNRRVSRRQRQLAAPTPPKE